MSASRAVPGESARQFTAAQTIPEAVHLPVLPPGPLRRPCARQLKRFPPWQLHSTIARQLALWRSWVQHHRFRPSLFGNVKATTGDSAPCAPSVRSWVCHLDLPARIGAPDPSALFADAKLTVAFGWNFVLGRRLRTAMCRNHRRCCIVFFHNDLICATRPPISPRLRLPTCLRRI